MATEPSSLPGDGPVAAATAEPVAPREPTSLVWPLRRWASLSLDLLLFACLSLSVALSQPAFPRALMMVVPLAACALLARLVFQTLGEGGQTWRVAVAAVVASGVACAATLALARALDLETSSAGAALAGTATAATLFGGAMVRSLELRVGAWNRRLFFVGSMEQLADIDREIQRRGDMRLVGSFTPEEGRQAGTAGMVRRIVDSRTTKLVMSGDAVGDDGLVSAAAEVRLRGVRVRALGEFYEENFSKIPLSDLTKSWFFFDVAQIHRPRLYGVAKRVWETTLAALLLVLSLPAMPVIALAIRLSSPGPALYRQRRVGQGGREVEIVKFRTMTVATEVTDRWVTHDTARITRVGRWLRKYRLDEIPQLWHVVRGHLALVGPRPEQPQIVAQLERQIDFYGARHQIRPGLTGWAQVKYGYGGTTQGALEKLQYEFYYLKHQGLRLDLLIVYETVRTVLLGRGW